MNQFSLSAALAPMLIGFLAVSNPATAEEQNVRERHVPHTRLWVKEVPASEAFDPGSFNADYYKEEIVLVVTKVDGAPGPYPVLAGDVIWKVNTFPVSTYDKLAEKAARYKDMRERVGTIVFRGDDDVRPYIELVAN